MFSLRNILLPTDFSPRCAAVARHAIALAGRFHSSLTLLHVTAPGEEAAGRERLAGFLAGEFGDLAAARLVVPGEPAETIVRLAHETGTDLIMMPTRGWGPFRRYILGSVTAKVLHDAPCAAWTGIHVEETGEPPALPHKVACALDVASGDGSVLGWAAGFASACGSPLMAIHAIPLLEFHPQLQYYEADMRKALVAEAREKIAHMLAGGPAADTEIHVEGGVVPRVVRAAAQDHQADLLVIGRSSGGSLLGRLRTNSYAIIREAPCPVISV